MGYGDGDNANFTIVNGKAYTEDNVLVYNLFIHSVPKWTNKEQFLEYFKKFGDIASVRLMNDRKTKNVHNQNTKIGFVNFSDPASAAKVLQIHNHVLNKKRIRVRACDTWHQPGASGSDAAAVPTEQAAGGEVAAASSDNTQQTASILMLNDDCLEIIMKSLEIVDQISFAGTCQRLRDVFIMHSKLEYKILHFRMIDHLTLWQTRQFLEMAGPHIENLDGGLPFKHTYRIIEFLGTYCTNVKSMSIQNTKLKHPMLRKLLKNMTKITDLELQDVELNDACIPVLKNLPDLTSLSLEDNDELSGRFIKDLTTIENLNLQSCRRLATRNFTKICESLTEMKKLNIQDCPLLKSADRELVKHLKKLEHLQIGSDSQQIHLIAQLPKLKSLELYADSPFSTLKPAIFEDLAKYQADQLEVLCVDTHHCLDLPNVKYVAQLKKLKKLMCPNNDKMTDECLQELTDLKVLEIINLKNSKGFTIKGLLALIKGCPKLHSMNISGCTNLGEGFPKEVLTLLKSQRLQRAQTKPLVINACRTGIAQFTVNSPEFAEATDLVKFKMNFDDFDIEDLDALYYGSDLGDEDLDDDDDDHFFFDEVDDIDDDYYMYYSDPDDDDNDFVEDLVRYAVLGDRYHYGDVFNQF